MTISDTMAGLRDASWYNYPGTASRYHILDGVAPACNTHSAYLTGSTLRPAVDVPREMRCQRSGCKQRWWAVDSDRRASR